MARPRPPRHSIMAFSALRVAQTLALAAAVIGASAFAARQPIETNIIRPLARSFEFAVVEGTMSPSNAFFTRQANTYVNGAPSTGGRSFMDASWFTVHEADGGAMLFAYASTDAAGAALSRLAYVREYEHNRFRVYRFDFARFQAAVDELESKVRRGNSNRRERRQLERLGELWDAHVMAESLAPSGDLHVRDIEDINEIIDFSGRQPAGQRLFVATGDVLELYVQ